MPKAPERRLRHFFIGNARGYGYPAIAPRKVLDAALDSAAADRRGDREDPLSKRCSRDPGSQPRYPR